MVADRGFSNVEEMDMALINAINSRVGKDDTLFHLGDFAFCSRTRQRELRRKINCSKIVLVLGNHDKGVAKDMFHHVSHYREISGYVEGCDNKSYLCMFHYPQITWNKKHYGAIHLHGHCHGSLQTPESFVQGRMMDVGVDTRDDFAPYSFEEVVEFTTNSSDIVSYDHH